MTHAMVPSKEFFSHEILVATLQHTRCRILTFCYVSNDGFDLKTRDEKRVSSSVAFVCCIYALLAHAWLLYYTFTPLNYNITANQLLLKYFGRVHRITAETNSFALNNISRLITLEFVPTFRKCV
jgi:hypothetical protein